MRIQGVMIIAIVNHHRYFTIPHTVLSISIHALLVQLLFTALICNRCVCLAENRESVVAGDKIRWQSPNSVYYDMPVINRQEEPTMTAKDFQKAHIVIQFLSKEWGQTPDETKQTIVQSFENILKEASPIDRLQYLAIIKTAKPTAEGIILQLAKEIVPEQFGILQPDPLQIITCAWSTFQKIAQEEHTTPAAVRKSIAETIDTAYASPDPKVRAYWQQLFPNGKPCPEAFIYQLANEVRSKNST